MKQFIYILTSVAILTSCKKKDIATETEYSATVKITALQNQVLTQASHPRLDLDQDGTMDLTFGVVQMQENAGVKTYFKILPTQDCQILTFDMDDAYSVLPNTTIAAVPASPSLNWKNINGMLLTRYEKNSTIERMGWWNGSQKLYLGVRLKKGQDYYYGWLKISHQLNGESNDALNITEMAVETVANKAIRTPAT